jgi:RNA polymerase sigma-70 factor, ECF subfamily
MPEDLNRLILRAKAGDEQSLGELLAMYRRYMTLLARVQIGRRLQGKVDASDIVQETFLEAHRGVANFQGADEPQFVQWLKAILAAKLANTVRHYAGTQRRDVRLEQQLAGDLDQSACSLGGMLVDPRSSPSQQVMRGEQARLVVDALAKLPDDYQTVLVLRHLEGLTFPEVGQRMGRSVDSVEKLWLRGLTRLRREFKSYECSPGA